MTEQHAVEHNALIHPCTAATTYQTLSRPLGRPSSSDVTLIVMSEATKHGTNSTSSHIFPLCLT